MNLTSSRLLALVLAGLFHLVLGTVVVAQPPDRASDRGDNDAAAAQPGVAPITSQVGRYPPNPEYFFRGNRVPRLADGGSVGFYISLLRFVPVLFLFFFWAWTSHWVNDDSGSLHVRNEYWNSVILGTGIIGFLVALCAYWFFAGFLALILFQGIPLGLYVLERNSKVPESARVMTPQHIQGWIIRKLALIGINLGAGNIVEASIGPDIQFIGKQASRGVGDDGRSRQVENSRGFMAAKELVYDALLRRCTDIHLEPKPTETAVRMRIDGVMYPVEPFDRNLGDAVVNIFKVLGAMDITEKRKSLDGSFRARCEGRDIDFRVATQGTRGGEKLSLRLLDQANAVSNFAQLGFRKQLDDQLHDIIHQPHGLMLVCGPTGAGKSTTLFAALSEIDAYQRNIITIEDPVEYKIDNVSQIEINSKAGQTFGSSLRSVLRQDPDVVMIGEIRDTDTAVIACQAANTGHMVFSTVHANDSITALYRMYDLGIEPFMLSSSLSGILAQRLARKLCKQCREAYKPKAEFLKKANLPAAKVTKLYRAPKTPDQNCPQCGGLGYRGRVGVFELLPVNDRMRDLIKDKSDVTAVRSEARKNGMLYMKEEGLRLVVKGVTSVDELLRVVK